MKICIVIILVSLIGKMDFLWAKSVWQKKIYNHEIELDLNMYYSCIGLYLNLTKKPIPCIEEENELIIYKTLFTSSLIPRFILLEPSINPLPCLGVYLKEHAYEFYDSAYVNENLNLVKSITSGFEEPTAASLFLGNIISFKPEGKKDYRGKGFMGYLLSVGDQHIKDNELIGDNWMEIEWKVKGTRITSLDKTNWSFRIGTKLHEHPYIKDVFYFSIYRSKTNYNYYGLSIFKNSSLEYTFDIDKDTAKIIRHFFLIGKKMPVKISKIIFTAKMGFLWEGEDKYTGPLKREKEEANWQILFRPNIEF